MNIQYRKKVTLLFIILTTVSFTPASIVYALTAGEIT